MPSNMPRRNLYTEVAKNLLLLIILTLIPLGLILRFKNIFLSIIIYFQLLVIWFQAEITERQNALFLTQFEASFRVRLGGIIEGKMLQLVIENISQNPAYNIMVSRVLEEGRPIPPKEWEETLELPEDRFIQCLTPGESADICYFTPPQTLTSYFINKEIEVSYKTKVGQDKSIYIIPLPGSSFMIHYPHQELPGILHKLFENLKLWNDIRKLKKSFKGENIKEISHK